MPKYEVTSPTGEKFEITAPEGATEADVMKYAQSQFQEKTPNALDVVGKAVSSMAKAAKDLVTGDDRRQFDYSELPDIWTGKGTSSARMSLGRDDTRKIDILRTDLGMNLDARADEFGNIYTNVTPEDAARINALTENEQIKPGSYYLNRPGISGQDFSDVVTTGIIEAATMGPFSKLGKVVPGGRIAGMGTGAATGSAIQDVAATGAGSTRGIDPTAALVAGLFGGGGEAAGQALAPVFRAMFSRGEIRPDGTMSDTARAFLEQNNIDLESITADWAGQFNQATRRAVAPENAAEFADARTLPVPVPLTRGDVTRSIPDQRFESGAQKGNFGESAQSVMEQARKDQNTALQGNADFLAKGFGAADDIAEGEGMRAVQARLRQDADQLKSLGKRAYDAAKDSGVMVDGKGISGFAQTAGRSIRANFTPATRGPALKYLEDLDKFSRAGSNVKAKINALEAWRQDISAEIRETTNDRVKAALIATREQFDSFLDGAVDAGLVTGDAESLGMFKEARTIWNRLRTKYEGKDAGLINDIIKKTPDGEFILEPEGALRKVFTANGVGFKNGAVRAVNQIKDLVGEDSPEWMGLKQEAVMRLLRSNTKGNNRGGDAELIFSGDKFSTAFRDAMANSPDLMKSLFTPQEIGLLKQFERVALRATNRRAEAMNPSGTSADLVQTLQQLFANTPGGRVILGAFGRVLGGMGEYSSAARARGAVGQSLPSPTSVLPGALGVTGAVGSQQTPEQQQYRPQ